MDQSIYVEEFKSLQDSVLTKYLFQNIRKKQLHNDSNIIFPNVLTQLMLQQA